MTFDFQNVFYAGLTVFVTVIFINIIRTFGKLPVSFVGPDLNLLTYGFLFDTTLKALRGTVYWPHFHSLLGEINRPTTLFVISLINLLALGFNMKLAHQAEKMANSRVKTWAMKPLITAIGVFSLVIFLFAQAAWEDRT
jgi:hypothetical protein